MNFADDSHILLKLGILESTEPSPKRTNYENGKTTQGNAKPSSPKEEKEKFVDVNINGDVISDNDEDFLLNENGGLGASSRGPSRSFARRRDSESFVCRLVVLILIYYALGTSIFAVCSPSLLKGDTLCHFTFCIGAFCSIFLASILIRRMYWVLISLLSFVLITVTLWSLHTFKHLEYVSFLLNGASFGVILYCGLAAWFSIWRRYCRYILSLSAVFSAGFLTPQILFSKFDQSIGSPTYFTKNDVLVVAYPIANQARGARAANMSLKTLITPDLSDYLIGSPAASFSIVVCSLAILVKLLGFSLCCLRLRSSPDSRMGKLFDKSTRKLSPESGMRFIAFQVLCGVSEGLVVMTASSKGADYLLLYSCFSLLGKVFASIIGAGSCSVYAVWLYLILNLLASTILLIFSISPFTIIIISSPISLLGLCCTLNIERRISPRASIIIKYYLSANMFGHLFSTILGTHFGSSERMVLLFLFNMALVGSFLLLNRCIAKFQRLQEILEYSSEPLDTNEDYMALTENVSDLEMDDLDFDIN